MPSELKKPEPFGTVTVRRLSRRHENHADQYNFYPAGHSPYTDNVDECHIVYTDAQLEQYAADRVREAVEAIADEYASRLQSDLEHGVRSINERYARNFNQSYPLLAGFMGWLNDRTLKEQTK